MSARPTGEIHPAAALFPEVSADELAALADDIKANGLRQPIVLDGEGRLVDGRSRLAACKLAKVEPHFTSLNGDDPVAFVVSMNVKRRNLTPSQRAVAAAEAWPLYEVGRPENYGGKSSHPKTRDLLRAAFGVSEKSIQQARALSPDLAAKVKFGTRSLADAYEEHRKREGRDNATRALLARLRAEHADLSEQVGADTLSLADAVAEADRRDAAEKQRRWAATMNVLDGLDHFDRDAVAEQAEFEAALIDPTAAATRGVLINPTRLRRASAWTALLADALERSGNA